MKRIPCPKCGTDNRTSETGLAACEVPKIADSLAAREWRTAHAGALFNSFYYREGGR